MTVLPLAFALLQAPAPPVSRVRPHTLWNVSDSAVVAKADRYFRALERLGHNGGVLIVRDERVLLRRSYGFADRERGIRADRATVYNIGSITKQFTAAAILKLEETGRLRTTDSLGRFLPGVPPDKQGITLHHLLTHTAGLESDFSPSDYEPTTRAEYVRRALASRLRSAPGHAHFYANSGYSLLAAIIEIVTGTDYETALTELILRPAGMRETGYRTPAWAPTRVAHGYQNGRDWGTIVERISVPGAPFWALRGNGGLATTLDDFARWDAALKSDRVLTASTRRKFMTGYVDEGPMGMSQYAYGWAVMRTRRGTRLVTHNGGNGVYVAEFLRFVEEGVTLFVTSTNAQLSASPMVRDLEHIVFGEPYTEPPQSVAVNGATLEAIAGRYRVGVDGELQLRVRDGALVAEAVGQNAFALLASGDTASVPGALRASARADTIMRAVLRGNVGPLVAASADGPDSTTLAEQERTLAEGRRERFGDFRSIEVLGTASMGGGELRTTVRLSYARGAATTMYTWGPGGRIVDIGAQPYAATPLVHVGAETFVSFDLRRGESIRLRRDGRDLLAQTPGGSLRLTRLPD